MNSQSDLSDENDDNDEAGHDKSGVRGAAEKVKKTWRDTTRGEDGTQTY